MDVLRKLLSWQFAVASIVCAYCAVRIMPKGVVSLFPTHPILSVIVATLFPIQTFIYGVAWWKVWREKAHSRGWGVLASIFFVALWVGIEVLNHLMPRIHHANLVIIPAIGIVSIVAFLWPDRRQEFVSALEESEELESDSTQF
jgi:hypothetical protein